MKTNYTIHSIEEEKHTSFVVKFPKERFTTKNNRYYAIVCETVKIG